jgi:hypothetical protein
VADLLKSFLLLAGVAALGGCASARTMWATMTGDALNGAMEEQGAYVDRGEREAREAGWKEYWRSNPDANLRMAEAFAE